ncbi:MAG TPA: 30S ribosomal protein S12 methylthiotransferase RimO, partial [Candidatus Omnitrophota bacterium]|nr:30S ribosomal protein S12 methylthiotransferase RimO [Candidatus Omnitrophota bacterium]
MKVGLVSLGCARTLVDSEVALGGLKQEGFEIVADVRKADVAIVNTCGFIEEAKVESIETILSLCELKKKGKLSAVVVLGCLAQRFGPELQKELEEVDGI